MKTRNCPICFKQNTHNFARAIVSPWIRELGVKAHRISEYRQCLNCEVGYFSYRYSNLEMSRIYKNYRNEKYLKIRNSWETWYNFSYNSAHDEEFWINARVQSLESFLRIHLHSSIRNLVDIGGDRGQYIPKIGQSKSYVLEASNKELVHGVTRISDLDAVPEVDLIIYSHVLEHVASPLLELQRMLRISKYLYVEVPFGIPVICKKRKSKARQGFKLLSSLSKKLWSLESNPSTGRATGGGVLVQSEHLNFFNEGSIKKIADLLMANHVVVKTSIVTPDKSTANVLQCLFYRK